MELRRLLGPESDADARAAHDAAVATHPHAALAQTARWGMYQDHFPDRTWEGVFEAVDGDRRVLLASVVSQRLPVGRSYLLLPRGFLVSPDATPAQITAAWSAIGRQFPAALFLRLDPPLAVESDDAARFEAAAGANPFCPVETTPTTTLLLDLSLDEEALLAQMHPKGRYNIRLAAKRGVTCRRGTGDDLPAFTVLLRETASRTGISVHPERVYAAMLEQLGDWAALELAEYQGQVVAGILTTRFAGTTTYYYGASSQAHKEVMAPYLLQWHAARQAKAAGDHWYDFLGVAPRDTSPGHPLAGVTDFKRKFGGVLRTEVRPREIVFRPALRRAFLLAKAARGLLRRA